MDNSEIEILFEKLSKSRNRGYFLNTDESFSKSLIESLLINEKRYGYQSCPCRLATGNKKEDLDIICPCYYRDADVTQYGTCYCGLYVSKEFFYNKSAIKPIPERRINKLERNKIMSQANESKEIKNLSYPIWRCDVCGYICARDEAPDVCPICGAPKERFLKFIEK